MPSRLVRYQQAGCFHFLTFSCYRRLPDLDTPEARGLFESALERIRKRYKFVVAGYVVMPEHVHLLVNEPALDLLDRSIQAIESGGQAFRDKAAARAAILASPLLRLQRP
jgi:putative transposase